MSAICPRCGNDLTHPTEVREQLCVLCHFDRERECIPASTERLVPDGADDASCVRQHATARYEV